MRQKQESGSETEELPRGLSYPLGSNDGPEVVVTHDVEGGDHDVRGGEVQQGADLQVNENNSQFTSRKKILILDLYSNQGL